jgi:hypothetical protein
VSQKKKFSIHLKRPSTSKERVVIEEYSDDYVGDAINFVKFYWGVGNYSSNCNRSLVLY